jgi:hypothetical protein
MSEPFSIKKALDLSLPAVGKSVSMGTKFVLFVGVLFCVGFTVYSLLFPRPTQTQHTTIDKPGLVQIDQRQIIENNERDVFFVGIRLWRIKTGISFIGTVKQKKEELNADTPANTNGQTGN